MVARAVELVLCLSLIRGTVSFVGQIYKSMSPIAILCLLRFLEKIFFVGAMYKPDYVDFDQLISQLESVLKARGW